MRVAGYKAPPPPISKAAAKMLPGENRLPLGLGEVIYTDSERAEHAALGFKPGDPIPPDLPNIIAAYTREATDFDSMPTAAKDRILKQPKLKLPKETSIKDLPPAKQRELLEAVADVKAKYKAMMEAKASMIEGAGPGINEAIAMAAAGINVENDLMDPAAGVEALKAGKAARLAPEPHEEQEQDAEPVRGGQTPPEGSQGPSQRSMEQCPRCSWLLSQPDTVEVSQEDKYAYVQSILGGKRFMKKIPLMGGQAEVTFRSLTSHESDMSYIQYALDAREDVEQGRTKPISEYWNNLYGYQLAMSLHSIRCADEVMVPEIGQCQLDEALLTGSHTRLRAYYKLLMDDVLVIDSLRKMVSLAFQHFTAVLSKLEAKAEDPDFWQATGTSA